MTTDRVRCGAANLSAAGTCRNYRDTCPITQHAANRKPAALSDDEATFNEPEQKSLSDDRERLMGMAQTAAAAYRLPPEMLIRDYWLVKTLHAWVTIIGVDNIKAPYTEGVAGRMIFAGGTALSAAWGLTQRWSEDIDLLFDPAAGNNQRRKQRQMRNVVRKGGIAVAGAMGCKYRQVDKGARHHFFEIVDSTGKEMSSVDVTYMEVEPVVWVSKRSVMSMVGRRSDESTLNEYPELGGFEFNCVSPVLTAMNKLLAQTENSVHGDLAAIRRRARDVYDLACIASSARRFEGQTNRDGPALLSIAESWQDPEAPTRPDEGFGSLASFREGTPEHRALIDGYDQVLSEMVWGDRIPLREAVDLAVSLDPGPAAPQQDPPYNPGVVYPLNRPPV